MQIDILKKVTLFFRISRVQFQNQLSQCVRVSKKSALKNTGNVTHLSRRTKLIVKSVKQLAVENVAFMTVE